MNSEINQEISSKILKTGTVTIGLVCKDGIVLGADRRISYGGAGGGVSYLAGQLKKIVSLGDRAIATMAGGGAPALLRARSDRSGCSGHRRLRRA